MLALRGRGGFLVHTPAAWQVGWVFLGTVETRRARIQQLWEEIVPKKTENALLFWVKCSSAAQGLLWCAK